MSQHVLVGLRLPFAPKARAHKYPIDRIDFDIEVFVVSPVVIPQEMAVAIERISIAA